MSRHPRPVRRVEEDGGCRSPRRTSLRGPPRRPVRARGVRVVAVVAAVAFELLLVWTMGLRSRRRVRAVARRRGRAPPHGRRRAAPVRRTDLRIRRGHVLGVVALAALVFVVTTLLTGGEGETSLVGMGRCVVGTSMMGAARRPRNPGDAPRVRDRRLPPGAARRRSGWAPASSPRRRRAFLLSERWPRPRPREPRPAHRARGGLRGRPGNARHARVNGTSASFLLRDS